MIRYIATSLFFIVTITVFVTSCSKKTNSFTDSKGNEFNSEKVYTSINGISDSSLNYAIYFPAKYNGKDILPVLFLLDPHGNGDFPVSKYSSIANKYGYILVGSNNSKNGMSYEYSKKHINALLKDVKTRFKLNEKRMFIGGFSGGAKLAILFANNMPDFIGVMACGGSLAASSDNEPRYYFAGIVGNKDFNYLEMRQSFNMFDQYGFDYTASVFNGNHEWPPVESFEMGIIGFDIYSTKIKALKSNDEWLQANMLRFQDSISLFADQNRILDKYETLQQARRWYYGLMPVSDMQKEIANTTRSQEFGNQLRNRQSVVKQEVKLRTEFIRAIELRNYEWWKTEVSKITSFENTNDEKELVKHRLLNYISMASFMLIKNDLNDTNLDNALEKIKIYELVDKNNPDVYLMYAKYYLLENNLELMKNSFTKAQKLGFTDYESYLHDEFWKGLLNQPAIKSLVN